MTSAGGSAAAVDLVMVEGVTKRFGGFTAVDDVSFSVGPGEVVGLLGANGAGKTTVIRMLLGLVAPTAGVTLLRGRPPDRGSRQEVGYVPQGMGMYTDMSVVENIEFAADVFGVDPAELPDVLADESTRLVGDLSLGVQRQLSFLIALQHSPSILVLDEPTSGVGPLARAHLWDTVREQAEAGTGVLVTTHHMSEAGQCDRLLLMSHGRLIASGSKADIVGDTRAISVRTDDWAAAFAALVEADATVTLEGRGVRVVDQDADDVRDVLNGAGITAVLDRVPATIEERMATLGSPADGDGQAGR